MAAFPPNGRSAATLRARPKVKSANSPAQSNCATTYPNTALYECGPAEIRVLDYARCFAADAGRWRHGELTKSQVTEYRPSAKEERDKPAPAPDVDALNRQRIRFDGLFTGPTW